MTYTAQDRRQSFLGRMKLQSACFRRAAFLQLTVEYECAGFLASAPPHALCSHRCVYVPDPLFRRWHAFLVAAQRLRYWPSPFALSYRLHLDFAITIATVTDRVIIPESWRASCRG